jgi:hypothetical protein
MAQIKISELSTLSQQLQAADYVPVIHGGVTYKYSPYNYFVKNSGDETIAGVKTFSASPVIPAGDASGEAVNYGQVVKNSGNETVAGIKTFSSSPIVPTATTSAQAANLGNVTTAVTPLSDLSRVMHITGDGTPIFPDNVAGRTYWQDDFTTTDSWSGINGTVSVSGGALIGTAAGMPFSISRAVSGSVNNLIRIKVKASITALLQIQLKISGVDTLVKTRQLSANQYSIVDFIAPSNFTSIIMFYTGASTGNTLSIDTIYIGSGLYDTPVYDKACCNRATNYGALPVPAPRGLGLAFNGAQYLQFDNPVIGTIGTIAFKYVPGNITQASVLADNSGPSGFSGIRIRQISSSLTMVISSASASQTISLTSSLVALTIIVVKISISSSNVVFSINGGTENTIALTLTPMSGSSNLTIGKRAVDSTGFLTGTIYDIGYDSRIWTQDDVIRYYNGDDPVDSQQKSINNVAHSIVTRDSKGNLRQPGLPVYADNASAITGGLVAGEQYRTSTGVLMVVY